jgi:hypothetical protein
MGFMPTPHVPVSWGELLDKMTILEIKRERIEDATARANVDKEYRMLSTIGSDARRMATVERLFRELKQVNEQLWQIEDAIREQEAEARFGSKFVVLARSVYRTNDRRAAIKREINCLLQSELVEEKSYAACAAV